MFVGIFVLPALVGCILAQSAPAPATTPAPAAPRVAALAAPVGSMVLTPSMVSQYMFRGVRMGGSSFEPTIEVASGNFVAGVWGNFPIKDKVPGQSNPEIDPYGSYTFSVNDSVSLAPGFTWYNYPNADTNHGYFKSTFEPNLALKYTVVGVRFTPTLYYDLVLKGPTYELTAAYAIPLKDLGSELDWTATAGTFKIDDASKGASPSVNNWGDYYLLGVSLPFAITKESKLTVGFAYTKGSGNFFKAGGTPKVENTAAVGRGVVTLSYAYTF
jgi:uncharacterized protein (TIGR02001 family)